MGLFDKKDCDICGGKIGMLGNRKLEDGNLCKDCANKLSPFFNDRRRSTVADIGQQLAYREANRAAVATFSTTRTLGTGTKVLLDENAGKFMVTSARKLDEANPDVLDFSQVTGCNIDVEESRNELKQKDREGKDISYNPPRYVYDYDFFCTIHVNAPYFDEIRFKVNDSSIKVEPPVSGGAVGTRSTFTPGSAIKTGGSVAPVSQPTPVPGGKAAPAFAGKAAPAGKSGPVPAPISSPAGKSGPVLAGKSAPPPPPVGSPASKAAPIGQTTVHDQFHSGGVQDTTNRADYAHQNIDYQECEALGQEIKEALTKVRQDVRDAAVSAQTPKLAVTCQSCGASTIPNEQGRCEYCRGAVAG